MNDAERVVQTEADGLREQLGATEREFQEIIRALNTYSIVAITDRRGVILYVNDRFCEVSKYSRHELLGQTHRIINSGQHPASFFREMWRVIGRGGIWRNEICNRAKDGTEYWVDTTITPLLDDEGRPERYVAIRTEETLRHLAEERVHELAFSDPVTGRSNRASVLREISAHIAAKPIGDLSCGIVVSLDDLSVVNDAFGYEVGDRLLLDAASKLEDFSGEGVHIGRIGSNTFGFAVSGLGDEERAAETRVGELVERVIESMTGTVDLGSGVVVDASVSVGYVLWAAPGTWEALHASSGDRDAERGYLETDDEHEILKSADIARKRARNSGGHRRVKRFRQGMLEDAQQRVRLVSELRRAIGSGELRLHAQPIVDRERRVIGEEGLIRWHSPERGMVQPREFIPLAEQTGLIIEIGDWVLEEACRVLAGWSGIDECRDRTFSVNLSARQLRVEGFGERVREVVRRHGLAPGRLKLELTESMLHTDLDRTISLLSMLSAEGVGASLDDFGTGYSSLSYLQQLPVKQLKIDRSFVSTVAEDESATAIVQTIVQLGRTFELQIVAEGVETEAQFERLRDLGVDAFQGFLFGRPAPLEAVPQR